MYFCFRRNSKDEHDQPSDRTKGIFKYDMGWQKRGSGRTYDSKPGVGAMIGNETGKICAYSVRIKDCRKCQFYSNKGLTPPPHTCHKNWDGSSKAMEPDVGGELVKTVEAQGVDVDVIIMDDDATTMARIRKDMNHNISKWSDINHTSKHLGNSLYSLQKKHKSLTTPVIKWFQKCFKYAIAQNKGNVEECRSALQQIVPHAFGDHEKCSKTWCGYIRNSDTYKHSSLPYGKDLSGKTFQQDLEAVFSAFANNAEKIAPGGSTKDVESFNNMVAAKAPKRCHYSASGSLKTRVDCAVAQKNIGNGYVNTVNESLGMSPGRVYHEHAKRKDTQRKRQQEYESLITVKRRKIGLKLNQKTTNHVREVREGTTYQSGVATQHHADITEIPPPLVCPKTEPITQNNTCSKVFCDIETGSLQKDADILQISAVFTDKTYDQYITPTRCVAPAASAVTGLAAQGGVLFHNGTPVPTFPLQQALQAFLAWLNEIGNVMLIGHNFKSFDFPRLIHAYKKCHLDSAFKDSVTCISDTLLIFRDLCPELDNHKQEFLVSNFLKTSYEAHNSLADVQSLQKLCQSKIEDDSIYYKHSVTTSSVLSKIEFESKSVQNVESFQNLVAKKIVSKQMSLKLGNSGLCLKHVQLAYLRGGPDGIPELLKEKVDGKDRVTANKRVIDSLTKYIEESSK